MIGVLADFSGMPESPLKPIRYRRFVDVQLDNLDAVLEACAPRLSFEVSNRLTEEDGPPLRVTLKFSSVKNFEPGALVQQIPPLRALLELRGKLADLRASLQNKELDEKLQEVLNNPEKLNKLKKEVEPAPASPEPPAPTPPPPPITAPRRRWREAQERPEEPGVWSRANVAVEPSILDELVEVRPAAAEDKERTRSSLKEFVGQVLQGEMAVGRDAEAMINARIAQIDHLMSLQLREVQHEESFQRLEATWRGLHFLLRQNRKFKNVKVRLLNITKKELLQQFERERVRFESAIARKVLHEAAETPGAEPFSLLIGDYQIERYPADTSLAERLARLGAVAHVPCILAAAPGLLGFSKFGELTDAFLLENTFDAPEWSLWRYLRERIESRYLGIVLPGILLRQPYSRWERPAKEFDFEEGVDGTDHSAFLWGNAVWAFAARTARDFERYGWFGARREPDDVGAIQDLPVFTYQTDDHDIATVGPVETPISAKRYLDLRTLGLIPLCQIAGTDTATFFECWSCHKAPLYPDSDPPTTNESAEIDCMLGVSRIAQYLRYIVQLEGQRFATLQDCEQYLRKWLARYVAPDYARDSSFEAAFPLLSAEIHVVPAERPRRSASIEASLMPVRSIGKLVHPVKVSIPIVLPWVLTRPEKEQPTQAVPIEVPAPVAEFRMLPPGHSVSGRDQFIRRIMLAEGAIAKHQLEVAVGILEELSEQIERHRLDEWESPELITRVWDLLRRCYLVAGVSDTARGRSGELFGRICRLDPSRLLE